MATLLVCPECKTDNPNVEKMEIDGSKISLECTNCKCEFTIHCEITKHGVKIK